MGGQLKQSNFSSGDHVELKLGDTRKFSTQQSMGTHVPGVWMAVITAHMGIPGHLLEYGGGDTQVLLSLNKELSRDT